SGVQIRNFWSALRVTRSNLPLPSPTHWENEIPSSSGGFGKNHQTSHAVIPSRARDLTHAVRITRASLCDLSLIERSPTSFGMTRVVIFLLSDPLFGHRDLSADAAALNVAIVHRLREDRRHDELAATTRFDLVINLEHARRRGDEEYRAVL